MSDYPKLFLDALLIDNTCDDLQKIYALVGNDRQFVIPYNYSKGKIICVPNAFETMNMLVTPEIGSNIAYCIENYIYWLNLYKLEQNSDRYNSYYLTEK